MVSFWETMDRACNKGPLMSANDFDMKLFKVTMEAQKRFGIVYDPKHPVPSDDDLADRLFEAGVYLYKEVGTYCIDTERVIRFSEDEIRDSIKSLTMLPSAIDIGEGTEKRVLFKRGISDPRKPLCIGGVVEGNPREGRDFVQIYKSVAQEPIIDGIYYGPAPESIEGRKWSIGSPLEVHAARNAVGWLREATRSVGRPGLHLLDANPSAIGTISACYPENGLRKSDAVALATISELKVNYEQLNKVAYTMEYGCYRNPYWTAIIGGFAGGPEGAAIVSVACALNSILVYRVGGAGYIVLSSIMRNPPINTHRQTVWVRNISMQAVNRNTNLICGGGGVTCAGPGTEMQLWEIAVLGLHISAGGGHMLTGCRKSKLTKPNQGTGMEPRWEGENARAAASLSRDEVNELVNFAFTKYEDQLHVDKAPQGFSFEELYNPETVEIRPHYLEIYHKVKSEMEQHGLSYD